MHVSMLIVSFPAISNSLLVLCLSLLMSGIKSLSYLNNNAVQDTGNVFKLFRRPHQASALIETNIYHSALNDVMGIILKFIIINLNLQYRLLYKIHIYLLF